jgi:hypothetical protein
VQRFTRAFVAANAAVGHEKQRRVLFLYPDSEIPAVAAVGEAVRKKLTQPTSFRIETFRESWAFRAFLTMRISS